MHRMRAWKEYSRMDLLEQVGTALGWFRKVPELHQSSLAVVLAFQDSVLTARLRWLDFQDSHWSPAGHHEQPLRSNQERQAHVVIRGIELLSFRGGFFIHGYQSKGKLPISAEFCYAAHLRSRGWSPRGRRGPRGLLHGADEPVAALRKGLDETPLLVVVTQRLAQLLDCGVEAVIEVHKSVRGPEPFLKFFPPDDLTRTLQEQGKESKRQDLQLDFAARFAEFACAKIHLKNVKADDQGRAARRRHTNLYASHEYSTALEIRRWGASIGLSPLFSRTS